MASNKKSESTNKVLDEKKKTVKRNDKNVNEVKSSTKKTTTVKKKPAEKKDSAKSKLTTTPKTKSVKVDEEKKVSKVSSTKSSTKKSSETKNVSKKASTTKTTPKKTITKKSTSSTVKKTTPKKSTPATKTDVKEGVETKVKDVTLIDVFKGENNVEQINNLVVEEKNEITKRESEKENVSIAKIEEARFTKKKDKKLLAIGIFIVLLGIIALIIALIANRIVDREFLSDSTVTLMMTASIIIEGFGAFIIINEA